ncbi:Sulfate adenylyltransferase subunit 2 [Quillaja saponaria]|uniref:Sulfate adenylyltransferase subunit 2 n=1 Tax=Quillaja saponaria TaxID=32244 RepID=A0AAD7KWT5_QUISA|nr:Sulfate adenylyltransferase subunit 2 [Quillaja saponaria]
MAQILNLSPPTPDLCNSSCPKLSRSRFNASSKQHYANQSWTSLQQKLKCNGRVYCFFSDNNQRQERARKALEGALSGKKNEFEKWDKEIKRREEVGGGGDAGGGGWFGWGGRFGWSNGDHFWQEAQQISLTVIGIILMYLIIAKGEVMLAVIFNPLLYALRGTRNGVTFLTSKVMKKASGDSHTDSDSMSKMESHYRVSAKENVLRKWGSWRSDVKLIGTE